MDSAFLGGIEFLIVMSVVAVAVVILGIMLRRKKPASKKTAIDGGR